MQQSLSQSNKPERSVHVQTKWRMRRRVESIITIINIKWMFILINMFAYLICSIFLRTFSLLIFIGLCVFKGVVDCFFSRLDCVYGVQSNMY